MELMKWSTLEQLQLSLSLMEGYLPSDEEVRALGLPAYTDADFADGQVSDTIQGGKEFLTTHQIPKVWPKMKSFSCNLSFLSGPLPGWLLYHPYFDFWNPYSLIFPQEEKGKNTQGQTVGFAGTEPKSLDDYSNLTPALGYADWIQSSSYYSVYPLKDPNHGINSDNNKQ